MRKKELLFLWIVSGVLWMCCPVFADTSEMDAQVWEKARKQLEKVLAVQDEYPRLPDNKLLARDKNDADEELEELYASVIDVLQISGLRELAERNRTLNQQIKDARARVVQYKEEMVSAPDEVALLSFRTTKAQLSEDIESAQEYIEMAKEEQQSLVSQVVTRFRESGMYVTADQAQLYLSLSMVDDDGMISLYSVFFNVQQISRQVSDQIRAGDGDADTIKRYYGMYVVLAKAMLLAYERVMTTIETVYMIRVDELGNQAEDTMAVTRQLLGREGLNDQQRSVLAANLDTQKRVKEMCGATQRYLLKVYNRLNGQIDTLTTNYEIAQNTYMTAWVGAGLLETIDKFNTDISELQNMKLDPVIPLNDEVIMRHFKDFTARLNE